MNQTSQNKPDTKEDLWQLIKESDEWTVGALIALYNLQEMDEQYSQSTHVLNAVGFNALDAHDMTSITQFYLNRGFLTPNQIKYARRVIAKYVGSQLLYLPFEPMPIKQLPKQKPQDTTQPNKWAGMADNGKNILIKFWFPKGSKNEQGEDLFRSTLASVKTLPGKRWNPDQKTWTAPLGIEAVQSLIAWDFEIADKLMEWWEKMTRKVNGTGINIPGLKMELYPFQKQGVAFIQDREGRALIGDEMGLGKTAQALAWLQMNPDIRPAIIIVPASVKLNWQKEVKMWMSSPDLYVIHGRPGEDPYWQTHQVMQSGKGEGPIIIINYDILANRREKVENPKTGEKKEIIIPRTGWLDILIEEKPKAIIMDEIHYVKNSKAYRTKDCKTLSKKADHIIGLSGTPITNRPIEFFPGLQMIRKDLFPSFWHYAQKFCGGTNNGFGWDFTGASNTKELHKLLVKTVMLRRLKKDVLPDLPEKTISVLPLSIDNRAEYREAENNLIGWIEKHEGKEKAQRAEMAETLVEFEKLKQLAAKGKMKQAITWIEDFLESEEKLVVFATHHKVIDQLIGHFKDIAVKLDGRDSLKKKQEAVDQFQKNNHIRLFIGNTKAAGVGITLTAASKVAHLEFPWTPGEFAQSSDRVHRIGQKNAVIIYCLVAESTIEEDIAALLDEKKKVLDMILDGKEVKQESLLTELLNKMRKEK